MGSRERRTRASVPRARVLYVYLPRRVMESQEPRRDGRNRVLPVVDVRHESAQVTVDEIGKDLVSDARHAVAHHAHRHARVELQPEEDAVEKGERSAERVADDRDGRRVLRREGALDGRENGPRGPVPLFCFVSPRCG